MVNSECRPHQRQRKRRRLIEPPAGSAPGREQYSTTAQGIGIERRTPSGTGVPPTVAAFVSADTPCSDNVVAAEHDTPRSQGYLGRSEYFGHAPPKPQEITDKPCDRLTDEEMAVLKLYRAFDLPPLPVQRTLMENFKTYCAPWMPVVDNQHLQVPSSASILLLQSIYVAGSRVAAASHISASSESYYRRAKALFFSSYESNPVTKIAAACLLNWWNPFGPEDVSVDGSGLWLRIAVSLAHQIGLHREPPGGSSASYRRRLWWTLVARDCQLSAAHGRPRGIDLVDSDIPLPSPLEFPELPEIAALFTAYVRISGLLGDTTQSYLRHRLSSPKRAEIRNALYCWVSELPPSLRLFDDKRGGRLNPYSLRTYSLYVPYFVTLTILYRSTSPPDTALAIAALSSAFLAGIFEELLARNDFRFLPPIFKFYVFVAGMAQSQVRSSLCSRSPIIEEELDITEASLNALSHRWPSAGSNLQSIQNLRRKTPTEDRRSFLAPLPSNHDSFPLFHCFNADLCRMWHLLEPSNPSDAHPRPNMEAESRGPGAFLDVEQGNALAAVDAVNSIPLYHAASANDGIDEVGALWDWSLVGSSGGWLLGEMPGGFLGDQV